MTSRKRRQRTKQPEKVKRGFSFLLWFGLTSKNLDMIPRCFLKVLILLILFPPIVFAEDFKRYKYQRRIFSGRCRRPSLTPPLASARLPFLVQTTRPSSPANKTANCSFGFATLRTISVSEKFRYLVLGFSRSLTGPSTARAPWRVDSTVVVF